MLRARILSNRVCIRPLQRRHLKIFASAMKVPFSKYHGLGNDFILIDNRRSQTPIISLEQAIPICNRHFGIGGDGVIFALPGNSDSDFGMRIFNSDGTETEMCGNGVRCLAKFIAEIDKTQNSKHKNSQNSKYKIETLAGLIQPEILEDGQVRVDMGEPVLDAEKIPTKLSPTSNNVVIQQELEVKGDTYSITTVSMGNPHACVYTKNGQPIKTEEIKLTEIGLLFEYNKVFPARACTEFVEFISRDHVKMVVWERGPGLTLACGTGACAVVVAGVLEGRLNRKCQVDAPGGSLQIEWREDNNRVYKTGPAEYVFSGSFHI